MNKIIFPLVLILAAAVAYAQDTQQVVSELAQVYTGGASQNGLIGGFSVSALVATLIFGAIGFVAFNYGRKNSEFKPMVIGICLMGYPYFVKSTLTILLIGVGLTAGLYFFRE
ncbi:MAG TPA: hypothetical protein VI749_02610 [Candidatus Omnitrophota bacterium]|nr:hypothetical protein [Candidatus Omnitrophota bacterium]